MQISLKDNEKQLFDLLVDVVKNKSPETVLRLCGGFVRDRLLDEKLFDNDYCDIDIAVSNMSGLDFANLVVNYLKENDLNYKMPTIIKANPDQSKHLETAMLEIQGHSIDFVNLRKETYGDSRIPTIEFGTIEEDASRRDLTVNALYFNLHTNKIEDYVGGIDDLYGSKAKTPIDPILTFIDDPLRIYRCVRFATNFNLEVNDNIIFAAREFKVVQSLKNKVSSERVGKEIFGYLLGNGKWKNGCFSISHVKSAKALELFEKMDLLHILFEDCAIDFYKSYYYLINNKNDNSNDVLVSTLAIILRQNPRSQITDTLLKIKCPRNIIDRVNNLIESAKFLKFNYTKDVGLRDFLRKAKDDYELSMNIFMIDFIGNPDVLMVKQKVWSFYEQQGGYYIKPPINGKDLIADGFTPGREMGQTLGKLDDKLLENPNMTVDEALDFCRQFKC